MKKMPTVFDRDWDDPRHPVVDSVNPLCDWVAAGEGIATRKYDGTCVMFDGVSWWARREVKPGKKPPEGFRPTEEDLITGKVMGWEPIKGSGFSKLLEEAVEHRLENASVPGTYELCGPKINGNPEGLPYHVLFPHSLAERYEIPDRSFAGLRMLLTSAEFNGVEGVVFRHPDGRMAKIKRKDFA